MRLLKHIRSSDLRGIAQLAMQATTGVAQIAEGVHQSVRSTIGVRGGASAEDTRGITGFAYKSVHEVARFVGNGVDAALAELHPVCASVEDSELGTTQREAVLAALNGVLGDHLLASRNPLAIPMSLRYRGQPLIGEVLSPMYRATSKVLLLIHGLCMDDLQRHAQHKHHKVEHGEALASALGYAPVYLRYNSGLHISQNGRELSAQLEQMVAQWPGALEEVSVVAHSMGGLLIRSAFHYAQQRSLRWPKHVKHVVFLGTPHHGAPLERIGNWVDTILNHTPYTAPFAKLGQVRSAGITDLRYGYLLDDDWQGLDRFQRKPDTSQAVPLPEHVACHAMAATTATTRNALAECLIGDGLVPLHSALGRHDDAMKRLGFPEASQWIIYRTSHGGLLCSPEVTRQMIRWLAPA